MLSHSTRAFWRHTRRRFESTHGGVLNLHRHTHKTPTTERRTDTDRRLSSHYFSLHMSVCLLISLALSARLSFFLFLMTMTMSTRPDGSLCTHGPHSPKMQECVGLDPFPVGRTCSHKMQETTVLEKLCKPRATWNEVGLHLCWKWVLCLVVSGYVWS